MWCPRPDTLKETLYVVTPIFNAARYRSRWRLYYDFAKRVAEAGAVLYTAEVAFGNRDFVVTEAGNPHHLQLRTWDELWLKENIINLAVERLPLDWRKVAWIDADVRFARDDWADETLHLLEHHPVIQMWTEMQDLDSAHRPLNLLRSFMSVWLQGRLPSGKDHKGKGAPGLAWAATREWWDAMGGLIDWCILGAGDHYMAHALVGEIERAIRSTTGTTLADLMRLWQQRAIDGRWHGRPIVGNVGVMPGLALHHWHGPKLLRRYATREQILQRHGFDPELDLKRSWNGLFAFTDRVPQLRMDIARYFAERNEDQL